jgi:hypothetical protein
MPDEPELVEIMNKFYPINDNEKQMNQFLIPIRVSEFHKLFTAENATQSFESFLAERGEKEIEVTPWVDDGEEKKRELNMVVAIKGVPFCSSSKCTKNITLRY